jgi:hypothetical protein
MLLVAGCQGSGVYHQSFEDAVAPDAVTIGFTFNNDPPTGPNGSRNSAFQSYNIQLRWDLK